MLKRESYLPFSWGETYFS